MNPGETPLSTVVRECYERGLAFWLFNHPEVVLRGTGISDGRARWAIHPVTNEQQTLAESYSSPFVAIARYKELLEFGRVPATAETSGLMTAERMSGERLWPTQPKDLGYKRLANGSDWKWDGSLNIWRDISHVRAGFTRRIQPK